MRDIKRTNSGTEKAGEVFRQFAWNIAGTLQKPTRRTSRPRPPVAVKS